jgi:hypothetical protein
MPPRYLTKSKFQLAMECPTKLYYADKKEYSNLKSEDSFLFALAQGGYQVGALAKCYYPDGIAVKAIDYYEAIAETDQLLLKENLTIFEAAIRYKNLFIRVDILIKDAEHLTLIEAKSKSIGAEDKKSFLNKNGIKSNWKKYFYDIAFQKYVLLKAFPNNRITSYLMFADKDSICHTDGLNQKFRIAKDKDGRTKISVSENISEEDLAQEILYKANVDTEISLIFKETFLDSYSFSQFVDYLSEQYRLDIKIKPRPGSVCKKCEFKVSKDPALTNLKSGFEECWSEVFKFTEDDFSKPSVLDIWNFSAKDKLIKSGVVKISQINKEDINPKTDGKPGWSANQRKWLQVEKINNNDDTISIDTEGLKAEMNSWIYPLHFIDFETAMCAIPLNKDERPYQGFAFQFSHHILHEDGRVVHAGQFLFDKIGQNPNIDFIRALKSSLENDNGTIFRYATHENSYLNMIYEYIHKSQDFIPDKDQLISFIKTISKSKADSREKWEGNRSMVDLCQLVIRFYYDPKTNGSNSIKHVFPAILSRSSYLQNKYNAPIYGAANGIPSLNFKNWQWIKKENNKVIDPYALLPKLFQDIDSSEDQVEFLFDDDSINQGGAASIAYARMQFSEMSELERKGLTQALLKYCELDTLAMVMIVEAWRDMVFGGNYNERV